MSLLKELWLLLVTGFYKYFAPNGAKAAQLFHTQFATKPGTKPAQTYRPATRISLTSTFFPLRSISTRVSCNGTLSVGDL
jgi:hypothetical protein